MPNAEPTRCSSKKTGILSAYAAITNQGLIRYQRVENRALGTTTRIACPSS